MEEELPPSPPAWLGAFCESFYPQANASELQVWGGRRCEKKGEGNIITLLGDGMGHQGRLVSAGQSFWLESKLIRPKPPPLAHPATSWEVVLSHNAVCLCVTLYRDGIPYVHLHTSLVSVWGHGHVCLHF